MATVPAPSFFGLAIDAGLRFESWLIHTTTDKLRRA